MQKYSQSGFFLIEGLIAIAFLSVISLIIAYQLAASVTMRREAMDRMQALAIASTTLERAMMEGVQQRLNEQHGRFFISCTPKGDKQPFGSMHDEHQKSEFIMLKVAVSWQSPTGQTKTITLAGGFLASHEEGL